MRPWLGIAVLVARLSGAAAEEPLAFQVDPAWPKRLPNDWIMGQAATPTEYDTALFRRMCDFHRGAA